MPRDLQRQFLRFLVVGTVGFAVDAGGALLLVEWGVDPYLARALSFPPAVLATWLLNGMWTFQGATGGGIGGYSLLQLTGMAANYAVYSLYIATLGASRADVVVALAAGSAVGLIVNFTGAKWLVFSA